MPESETLIVFKILGVMAKARDLDHALPLDDIAEAAHLGRRHAERYIMVLEQAGAIRAKPLQSETPQYWLTRYGLERLGGAPAS